MNKLSLDSAISKGTPFQQKVWRQIMKIPYGKIKTYKEIAELIGRPSAYRAVGQACKRNPIPIVIPCHRVVSSNGTIGGYIAGTKNKKLLLEIEKGRNK